MQKLAEYAGFAFNLTVMILCLFILATLAPYLWQVLKLLQFAWGFL